MTPSESLNQHLLPYPWFVAVTELYDHNMEVCVNIPYVPQEIPYSWEGHKVYVRTTRVKTNTLLEKVLAYILLAFLLAIFVAGIFTVVLLIALKL